MALDLNGLSLVNGGTLSHVFTVLGGRAMSSKLTGYKIYRIGISYII